MGGFEASVHWLLVLRYNKGKLCEPNRLSLYTSQAAHQAGAYVWFLSRKKRLGVFLLPLGQDASPPPGYPSIKFASTHYTPGWRETL